MAKASRTAVHDSVELLIAQWQRERPELDTRVPSIVARILRLSSRLKKSAEIWHKPLGLNWEIGEILIALRRSGSPFQLSPTSLSRSLLLTSGAMTNRLDRAESAGLVIRLPDPGDRRGTMVRLTTKGLKIADKAVTVYYEHVSDLLTVFDNDEASQLAALLSRLLHRLEHAEKGI